MTMLASPPRRGRPSLWTADRVAELRRRYEAGEPFKDIAQALEARLTTVYDKVRQLGLPSRRHVPGNRPRDEPPPPRPTATDHPARLDEYEAAALWARYLGTPKTAPAKLGSVEARCLVRRLLRHQRLPGYNR